MNAWADNPQAAQIDALIARAEQLTPVECDRLTEAAAGAAARVAAWFAAGDAAWAAEALVARDLIDENTAWNQAAYDLLTGPWRRVVGSIHPADEVLR